MTRKWLVDYEDTAQLFPQEQLGLFVLPLQGAWLLLAISDFLTWRGSYNDAFNDSEWDSVLALAEKTRGGLMDYATLDDVVEQLTRIADALEGTAGSTDAILETLVLIYPELGAVIAAIELGNEALGVQDLIGGE